MIKRDRKFISILSLSILIFMLIVNIYYDHWKSQDFLFLIPVYAIFIGFFISAIKVHDILYQICWLSLFLFLIGLFVVNLLNLFSKGPQIESNDLFGSVVIIIAGTVFSDFHIIKLHNLLKKKDENQAEINEP